MESQNKLYSSKVTRSFFWIIALISALFLASAVLYFFSGSHEIAVADPVQIAAATSEPHELIPALPVRLLIPAIGVDAHVQYVGLAETGTGAMDVPDNFVDVGWYENGVRPGMQGSAVIAGHYNGKSTPQAVFYDLDTLQLGDEVVIMNADHVQDIFQVVKIESYDHDASAAAIFISTDGKKRLNLITCSGDWMPDVALYSERTVIFTELITSIE